MKKVKLKNFKKEIDSFYDSLDRQIKENFNSAIVCQKGCAYCCSKSECYAFMVEAAYVVSHLNHFARNLKHYIAEKIDLFDREFNRRGLSGSRPVQSGILNDYNTLLPPCPFLKDNECVIYEARPMICRAYISHSIDECRGFAKPHIMEIEKFNNFISAKRKTLRSISISFEEENGLSLKTDNYISLLPRWIGFAKNQFYLVAPRGKKVVIL